MSFDTAQVGEGAGGGAPADRRPDHHHAGPHDSAHGHGPPGPVRRGAESRRLRWVLVLTGGFMVAEVVGGVVSHSLALLADAGHMFTDVGAIALSLLAMAWAQRPPNTTKTYGYVRVEILAALVNGASLLLIAGLILWEAWKRIQVAPEVDAPVMLAVAMGGLLVNVVAAATLHGHAHENLNIRGAYLHVLGDLMGSIGTIAAGVVILTTGWYLADPIISILISTLLLWSAWRLVRESTDILLEAAPSHIDVDDLRVELEAIDELHEVHDLHVWTLTSGFIALSGHGVVDDPGSIPRVLAAIQECAALRGIRHVTFQLEPRPLVQIERQPVDRR